MNKYPNVMRKLILLLLMLPVVALSWAQETSDNIVIEKGNAWISVPASEKSQVVLAVQALQKDFRKVMEFAPEIVRTDETRNGVRIVVVNDENPDGKALVANPRELDDFESHRVYVDAETGSIVLHGKDMRGTIYAIYSFSEQVLGVPPLWYWCSWQPEVKQSVQLPVTYDYFCPSPQVRYRAWFPNDQDLFNPWRWKSADNNERWLETMLRLKLNTVEYTASVTNNGTLNNEAMLYKKYGLVLTSHHMVALNNSFSNWDSYWKNVRKTNPPTLSVRDLNSLKDFWQYSIDCVKNSNVENLWQVAFRGKTDQPFWEIFSDAPSSDAERGRIISEMVKIQYDMICESTGDPNPFVRMTFYDEISTLLAKGYIKPPVATNMLWTFVAGRRDHYPFDDLVKWQNTDNVKLGYYMNLQFYSTGAHLAPAEGPWKMEDNYRYVQSKGPLTFSVVNAGNIREFLMEMAANAAMMWDSNAYTTNAFLLQYCKQYFGEEHAQEVADLYHDYYYSYWNQKKSDFPGGFDRQYIFQDLRHERAIKQINDKWNSYTPNPLTDIGYESIPGRSFRIEGSNQVDSIIAGTAREMVAFSNVAERCDALVGKLPEAQRTFFYDNLSAYAHYMSHVSACLHHFALAYKSMSNRYDNLEISLAEMKAAKKALTDSQHDIFSTWYASDDKFAMNAKIEMIQQRLNEAPPFTVEAGKAYTIANRNDNSLFVQDNGSDILQLGAMNDNACWEFISTGKPNCFYIRNLATGRYAQACSATAQVNVTMGTTPVEYVLYDCSEQEGSHCFGITSANLSVTDFTSGCIGWNWKDDNTVQTYAAVAGTNHRSFWKLAETTYTKPGQQEDKDLTALISNSDFEVTTGMIVDGTNFRGIPTGWHGWGTKGTQEYTQEPGVNNTTLLPKASYGSNGGCSSSRHGEKCCWVNCSPMPDDFKLFQTISLPAGSYRIKCLLSPMGTGDENLTNLRLFAGNNACYFASAEKYDANLGPETNRIFMGYDTSMDGSEPIMKEMIMEFKLDEATDIEIGIRTSNMLMSGSRATSDQGRFRVDYFRLFSIAAPHVHDYTHNGICTCEGPERFEMPEKSSTYYLLDNAGKVEWFANMVAANGGSKSYYAKLTDDIDFEREVNLHLPIGKTKGNKFKGVFDGQGHRIKNMIIYRPQDEAQGFFGYLQGNAACTVKNLIIDESCSVIAFTKAAGLAGSCQNTGATITIENCVNEANVTVTGQDAAGIIGGQNDTNPKFIIRNCVNKGNITSTNANPYAGGLCCYLGNAENTIQNVINLGTVTGHLGGNIGRMSGIVKGIVDLSSTDGKTQGIVDELSTQDIASGALTYYMNNVAGKEVFFQTLGEDAYPVPFKTSQSVKQFSIPADEYATYVCEGNVQFPSEVQAHAVVSVDDGYVHLSEPIAEVPADEPVLLMGAEGKYCYNPVATASAPALNQLLVATKKILCDGSQYTLANGTDGIGFYQATNGSSIAKGQVYLSISGDEVKPFYGFAPDDGTSIQLNPASFEGEGAIYNLAGQRVGRKQGIVIVDTKKISVK